MPFVNSVDALNLNEPLSYLHGVGIMFLVWLYVTDVVLDGNTHGMALNMMRIKKYAGENFTEFYAEKSL